MSNRYRVITWRGQKGFTLLEMLIAVVILGILAMIILPQITGSADDARVSTVKTNLGTLRNAIDVYAQQHNGKLPGEKKSADGTTDSGADATSWRDYFIAQLTLYSDQNGKTAADKTALTGQIFGPYLKGGALPSNPFYNGAAPLVCDTATKDVTSRPVTSASAWLFVTNTGVLIANDGGTTNNTAHKDY